MNWGVSRISKIDEFRSSPSDADKDNLDDLRDFAQQQLRQAVGESSGFHPLDTFLEGTEITAARLRGEDPPEPDTYSKWCETILRFLPVDL